MRYIWKEFFDRALLLGHDVAALEKGVKQERYFTVHDLEEGRHIVSVATPEQRIMRQETFFTPDMLLRQHRGIGFHDRVESYLFAGGEISEADKEVVGHYLPVYMKSVSILEKIIRVGEIWDVTVTGEIWGIKKEKEVYNILNIGRLRIEQGGQFLVRGNVLSLLCQELIIEEGGIGILPTPYSVDLRHGLLDGEHGEDGQHGRNGRDGIPAYLDHTILGPVLCRVAEAGERNGEDGALGASGQAGRNARCGGICRIAELTVRDLKGPLVLFSQAGKGGDGGDGGDGGNGGNGGNGAQGAKHLRGVLLPGKGGNGGHGGHGGRAGNGGHGGTSSHIFINVPPGFENEVHCTVLPSEGGKAGIRGKAGLPGQGGMVGGGYVSDSEDGNGTDGLPGEVNKIIPRAGKQRPAPPVYINDRLL